MNQPIRTMADVKRLYDQYAHEEKARHEKLYNDYVALGEQAVQHRARIDALLRQVQALTQENNRLRERNGLLEGFAALMRSHLRRLAGAKSITIPPGDTAEAGWRKAIYQQAIGAELELKNQNRFIARIELWPHENSLGQWHYSYTDTKTGKGGGGFAHTFQAAQDALDKAINSYIITTKPED